MEKNFVQNYSMSSSEKGDQDICETSDNASIDKSVWNG